MEVLKELGERIAVLLERVKSLKQENEKLRVECDFFRSAMKDETTQFDQEKQSTRIAVEELIHSIDTLTKGESP